MRVQENRRTNPLVVVLLGVVAACGEAPPDQPPEEASAAVTTSTESPAACDILTTEEIQAATGIAPAKAEARDMSDGACDWTGPDARPLVSIVMSRTQNTYEEYMQNVREQGMEDIQGTRVEGVGDYAVWYDPGYLNAVLRGRLLVVWVYAKPTNGKTEQEAAIELARAGLARLP
jgi:hypothetical protein